MTIGTTKDANGELTTGVNAAEKGMINGIAIDTEGRPLSNAVLGVIPAALHTGHIISETAAGNKIDPVTSPKEDLETSDEAAAAGHGITKKKDPIGVAVVAKGDDPVVCKMI